MTVFNWEDIDHSLVGLRLSDLAEEMHNQIRADESRIRFENRNNRNRAAVPSLVLQMKEQRADEWFRRTYEIYCDVWRIQGWTKSGSFVRDVFTRGIIPIIHARAGAIAGEFELFAKQTGFPTELAQAYLTDLRLRMMRLQDRWRRRLEAEATECEHTERRKRQEATVLSVSNDAPAKAGSIQQAQGDSLVFKPADRLPEDQAADMNVLSLTVCAVCGHYEALHDQAGCFRDSHGRSSADPGILPRSALKKTGALCWCPKFVADFSQAADLICQSGNSEALKHGTAEAISRGDSQNAHRLLDQFIVKTPPETRDSDWVRATQRSIARLQSVTNPTKAEGGHADSLADQVQVSPELSGGETETWETVEISFLSDERVQIRNGANRETRNYAEFGFEDGRSKKPNQAWETLRLLAAEGGTIRDAAKVSRAWPKVEKRVQEIRKVLRKHFGISADPIPFVEGTGYQAVFKITCRPSFDT